MNSAEDTWSESEPGPPPPSARRFPCAQCGAKLEFQPGTTRLGCPYCGQSNEIPSDDAEVEEIDFRVTLKQLAATTPTFEPRVLKCDACAAEFGRREEQTALACPFCGSNIVATSVSARLLKPQALLPFKIVQAEADARYRHWLRKLWFAPSALQRLARVERRISGMYVPYWTYDARTTSAYVGERGDHYWVTVGTGKNRRRVRRTRWWPARGTVWNRFDDLLVLASRSLPRKYADRLEPWDLNNLVSYDDAYLSGFSAEAYQIDLPAGFEVARQTIDAEIREEVRRDIGGDEQRIHSIRTRYDAITFKHLLLPVWLNAYRYRNKTYRFLVNARSGEVQGERPYSWVKIVSAVLAVSAVIAAMAWLVLQRGG